MTKKILEFIKKFQNDSSRINQSLLGFVCDDMILLTTDYKTAKSVITSEKEKELKSQKSTLTEISVDADQDVAKQLPTGIEKYSSVMSYLKPHLIDESIHEPIEGSATLILATSPQRLIEHNAKLTERHITPNKNDVFVNDPKVMQLYSVVSHCIIEGNSETQPYGIYKTFDTRFDSAVQEIDRQITEEVQNLSEKQLCSKSDSSELESEK